MKLRKQLLSLLTFSLLGTWAFGATLYLDGTMLNTNGASIPIEYSTDNFNTSVTVYTTSAGATNGSFKDTFTVSGNQATIMIRYFTCTRTVLQYSINWDSSKSNVLSTSIDFCPGSNNCMASYYPVLSNDSVVSFVNTSTGITSSATFYWDFGDGTNSTDKSPVHTYANNKTFNVCLYIQDTATSCSDTLCASIKTGTITNPKCRAFFDVQKDTNNKYGIEIINRSIAPTGATYTWDFGDGSTGTGKNPTHAYKNFGKYELCLTVSFSGTNCNSMYCDSIGIDSNGMLLKAGFSIKILDETEEFTASVSETESRQPKVYPNPAQNSLYVDVLVPNLIQGISIYDIRGTKVLEVANGRTSEQSIDLSRLINGTYFIQIQTNSGVFVRKISKM